MGATVDLWTPPAGMAAAVVKDWRAFYARALDQYGITPDDYRVLYVAQKGRCWICRKAKGLHPDDPAGRGSRRLGIDHDHLTGAVRGLLCTGGDKTCNRIIGWLSGPALQRAADYVTTRAGQPARVLGWIKGQEDLSNAAGVQMTDAQRAALAQFYLWPDDE
jgi:hypothetical protein